MPNPYERESGITQRHPFKHAAFEVAMGYVVPHIEVTGVENLEEAYLLYTQDHHVIIASNHRSHIDFPVLFDAIKRTGHKDMADDTIPLLGKRVATTLPWLADSHTHIKIWPPTEPPTQETRAEYSKWQRRTVRGIQEVWAQNKVLDVFPEGGRAKQQGMIRAYGDVARYLLKNPEHTYVLPTGLTQTDERLAYKSIVPKRGTVGAHFGTPIWVPKLIEGTQHLSREERNQKVIDNVMFAIADLLPQEYRGYYSSQGENHEVSH